MNFWGACYRCICTVCTGFKCPYRYGVYKHCQRCHNGKGQSALTDCEYFTHKCKHRVFHFRKCDEVIPHSGTYILYTDRSVLVGSYDQLVKLRSRLGGNLKKIDYISFLTGEKQT